MMGLRALGLLAITWAWVPFVGCDAFNPPPPPAGTGGLLGVGGAQTTGGSGGSGGSQTLGPNSPCPPPQEDCCYEWAASYYCSGDSACKDFHQAIECSPQIQCEPCPFGCADGHCLHGLYPQATGGATGLGGLGGLGGEGS